MSLQPWAQRKCQHYVERSPCFGGDLDNRSSLTVQVTCTAPALGITCLFLSVSDAGWQCGSPPQGEEMECWTSDTDIYTTISLASSMAQLYSCGFLLGFAQCAANHTPRPAHTPLEKGFRIWPLCALTSMSNINSLFHICVSWLFTSLGHIT